MTETIIWGPVEMFYDFQPVVNYSISGKGQDFILFMNESLLSIATRLKDQPRVGAFVQTIATNKELVGQYVTEPDIRQGADRVYYKRLDNLILAFFPIKDYNGKQIGVMCYLQDTSAENHVLAVMEQNLLIGIAVVMVILLALLSYVLYRVVIRPIGKTMKVAQSIAKGDVSQRLNWDRGDEIGRLADSFDEMAETLQIKSRLAEQIADGDLTRDVDLASDKDALGNALEKMVGSLNEVIGRVLDTARVVAVGSTEISDATQSLSQGATEQAASLEEISSSLIEIGSQIKTNAENATQADQLVGKVKESAQLGDARMGEMVTAMGQINDSSTEIAKIIKTIDDIAFQTNLLALNAAVEAARAGKHGKGFAVVAQEVRNLAQKSAEAAQKTAQLIEDSVSKVETGSKIVDKTALALREMVDGVSKITTIVSEIARASNEQAQGVAQISQGMGQIEQVTQQNTALAEQTAASVTSLSAQAEDMRQAIAHFNLKQKAEPEVRDQKALDAPEF